MAVDEQLTEAAARARVPKSSLAVRAVDEWLRMQAHPGVVFRAELTGERRAALAEGPQVWTVAEAWLQHSPTDRSVEGVAEALGLSARQVDLALDYWAEHRSEIDSVISAHHAAQDEALAAWERRAALDRL